MLPDIVTVGSTVSYEPLVAGTVTETVGGIASSRTLIAAVPLLPWASNAVTVTTWRPDTSGRSVIVQLTVPVAVPLVPASEDHYTRFTPTLSEAVPDSVTVLRFVKNA